MVYKGSKRYKSNVVLKQEPLENEGIKPESDAKVETRCKRHLRLNLSMLTTREVG